MKKVSFLLFCVSLFSCADKESTETYTLTAETVTAELPFMRFPQRIGLTGSHLVMLDLAADSCFYHVVSYPDFNPEYSLGKRGESPNEIVLPTPFRLRGDELLIMDGARSILFKVNLATYAGQGLTHAIHLNNQASSIDYVCMNDTTFFIGDMNGQYRLLLVTPSIRKGLYSLPEELTDEDNKGGFLWRSYMDIHHELKKIAMVTQFGDVLEIYDIAGNTTQRIIGEGGVPASSTRQKKGYFDVKWCDNKIFALCSDWKKETGNEPASPEKRISGGNIIQVFDQEGNKEEMYVLDTYLEGFTIDKKGSLIIGITSNSDHPVCLFRLPAK